MVEDDGRGFDPEPALAASAAEHRLGLLGMRERVALVGGTLTVESDPGRGTTVIARVPLPAGTGEAPRWLSCASSWPTTTRSSARG